MLSYQHAFHAGNRADVHKHAMLAWCIAYLTRKSKPLSYIETHAGRGRYDLGSAEALKTGEAATGVATIEQHLAEDHPYRRVLETTRAAHGADAYPGSPLIAAGLLRDTDPLHLAERHPQEYAALRHAVPRAQVHQRDGFEMLGALTPPDPRRGLCLIDPPYEVKSDYQQIPKVLAAVHRKWPVGCLMLWYPILVDGPHKDMLAGLANLGGLTHEVRFPPARAGHRMVGSGLFVVNAPYGFDEAAADLSARMSQEAPR